MKRAVGFRAAGIAANHASELCARASTPDTLLPLLGKLGERIARLLGPALGPLCGGAEPVVSVSGFEKMMEAALAARIGPLAANALLAHGRTSDRTLLSIEAVAIMAQLDRAFGGSGKSRDESWRAFPPSANILAKRLEGIAEEALRQAVALDDGEAPHLIARDSQYHIVAPFAPGSELAVLELEVREADCQPWRILLATRLATLPRILSSGTRGQRTTAVASSPLAEPFAGMNLPANARLVDMPIKLSRLAGLAPGMTIPIALDRQVPLRVGDTIVAKGTVGELDDRIAVQITRTMFDQRDNA